MAVTDNLITAEQARKLAGPTVEEHVQSACEIIKLAAEKKKRKTILSEDLWVRGAYDNTPDYQHAKAMLENLGFVVKFHYDERQFLEMYTVVEW